MPPETILEERHMKCGACQHYRFMHGNAPGDFRKDPDTRCYQVDTGQYKCDCKEFVRDRI